MTRKEFLKMGFLGLSVGLGALIAARCKSNTSPAPTGDTNAFPSSSDSGHSHTLTMTQAQLTSVNNGGTTSIVKASASSHTHTFSISKWF